jgi:hypothetical protein
LKPRCLEPRRRANRRSEKYEVRSEKTRHLRSTARVACVIAIGFNMRSLSGQTTRPGASAQDPLAARQQIARDRLAQLEDRMYRLAEKLNRTEPQQAKRLEDALHKSGELLIRSHMEQAIQLLEQTDLAQAVDHQAAADKALEQLLKLLTESTDDSRQRREEFDRVRELRERVDELLQKQLQLRSRTDPAERTADQLAAAAARLQAIINRQQEQNAQTQQIAALPGTGQARAAALAGKQADIREQTESLNRDLAQMPSSASQPPAGTQPESSPLAHLTEEARGHLQEAADQMNAAEQDLSIAKPDAAQPRQNKALESLQRAMDSLKKQQQGANPLNSKDAAGQQQALQSDAGKLADNMEGKAAAKPSAGSQPSGAQPGGQPPSPSDKNQGEQGEPKESAQQQSQPPSPGAGSVRKAQQHMKKAGDKLDKDKPADATKDQDKAIEQLEQAKAELQESLDQLRREQQEEMLASLEQRFRTMLLEQKGINAATDGLDKRKAQWTRPDNLSLAALSEKQKSLSGEASKAIDILTQDGTSVVFPEILVQIRDDMTDVSKRLAAQQTGPLTREIEAGILSALQELVDAVEQRRKEGPPPRQPQAGGGQGGDQASDPLLPGSAELKLLRSCQTRVNRQTRQLQAATTQPGIDVDDQSRRLSTRQDQLADMARKINDRAGGH